MKISIITAVYNRESTMAAACTMMAAQAYTDIEWVVVDGGSTDGTLEVLAGAARQPDILVSEPDKGIYDALNKGLKLATGEVVGLLHSDDFYPDASVLSEVAKAFEDSEVDAVYGDLEYVAERREEREKRIKGEQGKSKEDKRERLDCATASQLTESENCQLKTANSAGDRFRVVRHWKSGAYSRDNFKRGWMPPHPAFYMRRRHYKELGGFDLQYKIAADYDSMVRYLWKHQLKAVYIPKVLMQMRTGGVSNRGLKNIIQKSKEDYAVMRNNGLGLRCLLWKNLSKIPQFFKRSKIAD